MMDINLLEDSRGCNLCHKASRWQNHTLLAGFGNTMGATVPSKHPRGNMVKTKSVYTPIDRKNDGIRILATRFRGRGLPTRRYDVWMPSLGPSERLLRKGQAEKITWA